jgi:hypothetical protein
METTKPELYDKAYPLIRDTKILNFSMQSSSGYLLNGDFKSKAYFELANYIDYENDDTIEYISISMPHVVICNSNYIITSTNNTLKFTATAQSDVNITIPQGNYTAQSFIRYFNSLANGIVVSINLDTNIFTFTRGGTANNFTISGTADYIIGFSGSVTIASGTALVMPRVCNFLPIPRFNVCADFLNNGTILGKNQRFSNSTLLASVPNTSKNNTLIVYESEANEFILKTLTLNTITISILDDNGNLINFNGISSYFQLKLNIYRKRVPKILPFNRLVDLANTTDRILEETEALSYA